MRARKTLRPARLGLTFHRCSVFAGCVRVKQSHTYDAAAAAAHPSLGETIAANRDSNRARRRQTGHSISVCSKTPSTRTVTNGRHHGHPKGRGPPGKMLRVRHRPRSENAPDDDVRKLLTSQGGQISASRRSETISRHRRASSRGEQVVGRLFFDFEAVRSALTEMLRAGHRRGRLPQRPIV